MCMLYTDTINYGNIKLELDDYERFFQAFLRSIITKENQNSLKITCPKVCVHCVCVCVSVRERREKNHGSSTWTYVSLRWNGVGRWMDQVVKSWVGKLAEKWTKEASYQVSAALWTVFQHHGELWGHASSRISSPESWNYSLPSVSWLDISGHQRKLLQILCCCHKQKPGLWNGTAGVQV